MPQTIDPSLIKVAGRGVRRPYVQGHYDRDAGTVTLRIDDDDRPEFWAEITLDWKTLEVLLASLVIEAEAIDDLDY